MTYITKDLHCSFKELAENNLLDIDYRIVCKNINSHVSIIAIHGGAIERFTSEIVRNIANDDFNYYIFEGIKPTNNRELHISSFSFDEPTAIDLVTSSDICISIHGFKEDNLKMVYTDSYKNNSLLEKINKNLMNTGMLDQDEITTFEELIKTSHNNRGYKKICAGAANIFNKSKKTGVQIEISTALRDYLKKHPKELDIFTTAIKRAIHDYLIKS